jgi:protein CpxP
MMNKHKLGMLAGLALGGVVAFGSIARAQDKPEAKPAHPPVGAEGRRPGMQDRLTKITEELKLTDDQKQKWEAIFKDQSEKAKEIRANTALSGEEKMAKAKEIRDASDAKIKALLTPEQQEKWKAFREKMRENAGRGRPGGPAKAEASPEKK